jgi:uncharacterized protein (DUF1330 family)
MSALVSVTIQVKDPEKLKSYISQVPATMAPHGAKMLSRGKIAKVLNGEVAHQMEAVFEFPSEDAIDAWFNSDAYRAIVAIREEAAHMNIVVLSPF